MRWTTFSFPLAITPGAGCLSHSDVIPAGGTGRRPGGAPPVSCWISGPSLSSESDTCRQLASSAARSARNASSSKSACGRPGQSQHGVGQERGVLLPERQQQQQQRLARPRPRRPCPGRAGRSGRSTTSGCPGAGRRGRTRPRAPGSSRPRAAGGPEQPEVLPDLGLRGRPLHLDHHALAADQRGPVSRPNPSPPGCAVSTRTST